MVSSALQSVTDLREQMGTSIIGQDKIIERIVMVLLADGNLLLEGLPGLAKTRAITSLSKNLDAGLSRIQFTPDLLPSDITGTEVYQPELEEKFVFQMGPVFNNLILADEINRAPAKVQAALLEAMQERQVTVAGKTHKLPGLFMVMATQKGYAYAEAGELDKAIEIYSSETTAEGFYNLGVLFAMKGDAEAAQQAFLAALEINPDITQARDNLQKIEIVMDSLGQNAAGSPDKEDEQDQEPQQLREYQDNLEAEEQAQQSDQTYEGKGDITEEGARELDEASIDFFDTGGEPAPFDPQDGRQSLLRQVEEDPSVFLRRKFAYEIRNRNIKQEPGEKDW